MFWIITFLSTMLIIRRLISPSPSSGPDRKGKKKASATSSPLTDIEDTGAASSAPTAKRTRQSLRSKPKPAEEQADQEKGKAKVKGNKSTMPRKTSTYVHISARLGSVLISRPKNKRGGLAGSSTARPPKGTGSKSDKVLP
jgi:hypothetical protein